MKNYIALILCLFFWGLLHLRTRADLPGDNLLYAAPESQSVLVCRLDREGDPGPAGTGLTVYSRAEFTVLKSLKGPSPGHMRISYVFPSWLPHKKTPPLRAGEQVLISGSVHDGSFRISATAAATPENLKNLEALLAGDGKNLKAAAIQPNTRHGEQQINANTPINPPFASSVAKNFAPSRTEDPLSGWLAVWIVMAMLALILLILVTWKKLTRSKS